MFSCRRLLVLTSIAWAVLGSLNVGLYAKEPSTVTVPWVLNKFSMAREISGAVTLVHERGRPIELATAGMADMEHELPMRDDTMFGIMSMTKPISATALMILVDEGKVSVDDPVEKYIPAFADAKTASGEAVHGLKIRHLLTHTSGLTGDQTCPDSLEVTANKLAARPFAFRPGERWEYGPSINVVGRIVEVVSGQPFDEFLRERIFVPLAMNDTTFHLTEEQRQRLATLYKKSEGGKSLVPSERWAGAGEPGAVPSPSGGLFSTADDMDRFYQMILHGGELDGHRIVSENAVHQMTTIQTGKLAAGFVPGSGWGLGWSIVREPQGVTGMLSPGTFGHGGAYGTQGWVDPVKQRVFVLMFQRGDIGNSDGSDIRKEFQQAAVDGLENQ